MSLLFLSTPKTENSNMKCRTILLHGCLSVSLYSGILVIDAAFSTTVPSGEENCFSFRSPVNVVSTISGNFDCLDDDLPSDPIGVVLYDSKMTPVWRSSPKASEGTFSLQGSGKFELCIQNGSQGSDDYVSKKDDRNRVVGFAVRVIPPFSSRGLNEEEAGPDNRLTANLMDLSAKLMDGLHTLSDHQEYMKERERRHSLIADATFHRIVQWTVLEAIVLALISFGQVLYLKKFFEQRRYL